MRRKMDRDSWNTRVAGARETRLRSKNVCVCNGEGKRKAEQRTERGGERGRKQMERKEGDGGKKGKWKWENRGEGKRKSETARERDVRVTGRAARRVASRRLASPRVASRHSKLGLWERGGSFREEAVSSQLPFYAAVVASARGLPDHAGFNYSPSGLFTPAVRCPLFLPSFPFPLSQSTDRIVPNERSDSHDGIREIASNSDLATEESLCNIFSGLWLARISTTKVAKNFCKCCMQQRCWSQGNDTVVSVARDYKSRRHMWNHRCQFSTQILYVKHFQRECHFFSFLPLSCFNDWWAGREVDTWWWWMWFS